MSSAASDLVMTAMGFLGVPYKRGGSNATEGFDRSGFVRSMFEQSIGLVLPRRAEEQAKPRPSSPVMNSDQAIWFFQYHAPCIQSCRHLPRRR